MVSERPFLHSLAPSLLETAWRDFEPSDLKEHRNCGYIPTGPACHVCGKKLGKPLSPPYSYQTDVLKDDHLNCLIAGGEQVGKSYTGAMKCYSIICAFLAEHRDRAANEVAWLVGASYEQTAREFEYLKMWLGHTYQVTLHKADNKVDPGEIHIKVPGGLFKIKTKSSDDSMASLRMESPVVALLCEAAITTFDTYTRLRSRVARARADFPGYGAIVMISTFEGSTGWYPDLYAKWQLPSNQKKENAASFSMPSFSNIFIYRKGEKDPEIQAMRTELSEDEYKERILAVPSPPKGRVFDMFDATSHVLPENADYNPRERVLFGVDPGFSGQPSAYAVEVFQPRRLPCGQTHFQGIDEIFEWRLTNDKIVEMAVNRPWWNNEVELKGVIDIAATYHAGSQQPAADVWKHNGNIHMRSQKVNILPGIQRMAGLLNICVDPSCGEPRVVFSPNQKGVIAEFSGLPHPFDNLSHPYRWPTDRTGMVIGKNPEDKYCDGIKATTYLFIEELGWGALREKNRNAKIKVKKRSRRRELAYA